MKSIPVASLFFFALLQAGCSRPVDAPDTSHPPRTPEHHARAAKQVSGDQALALLMSQLKSHNVADLECLAFQNESDAPATSKAELWEFAARERHDEKCGGDPAVFPVRNRYKVSAVGKVWVYDVVNDRYMPF